LAAKVRKKNELILQKIKKNIALPKKLITFAHKQSKNNNLYH